MRRIDLSIDQMTQSLANFTYDNFLKSKENTSPDKTAFVEKFSYNIKVAIFNISTIVAVAMAVFSVLLFSPIMFMAAAGFWCLRGSIVRDIKEDITKNLIGPLEQNMQEKEFKALLTGQVISDFYETSSLMKEYMDRKGIELPSKWDSVALKICGVTILKNFITESTHERKNASINREKATGV